MNFLAHLYLAEPTGIATPPALVGSLMPDLVRGPLPRNLAPEVAAQVARHRRIDRATDTHPAFLEAANLFRPTLGRLAGIAADVCFDAALCRAWPTLHPLPLAEAVRAYHAGLFRGRTHMPPRMRQAVRRMLVQGWLLRYASDAGLAATFVADVAALQPPARPPGRPRARRRARRDARGRPRPAPGAAAGETDLAGRAHTLTAATFRTAGSACSSSSSFVGAAASSLSSMSAVASPPGS